MKKLLTLMLAVALALSLVACGGGNGDTEPTEASTENSYTDIESCAEYAIDQLKSVLKNPSSLIVNSLYAVEADDCYIFDIDYSAENGFGGTNRDNFFIAVYSIENGFAVLTYGTGSFSEAENQMYSSQFFDKFNKVSGSYIFDPETYQVVGIDESGIDTTIDQRVELVGKMRGEKSESTGYGGAWDFEVNGSSFLQVVYFVEGTDLSWYEQFTGAPYEITISAIKDENGHYREAEIVEDTVRNATYEERFQRFDYYDRKILALTMPDSGIEPMNAGDIQAVLTGATFSMRNNYNSDEGGTHTITFNMDGTMDTNYIYNGQEFSMYEAWRIENGSVICTHNYTKYGEQKTIDYYFTPYQYDETRYLLIEESGDKSMVLTVSEG